MPVIVSAFKAADWVTDHRIIRRHASPKDMVIFDLAYKGESALACCSAQPLRAILRLDLPVGYSSPDELPAGYFWLGLGLTFTSEWP